VWAHCLRPDQAVSHKRTKTSRMRQPGPSPNDVEAHFRLGSLLLEQGDLEAAVSHLSAVTRAAPWLPHAHVNLGLALLQLGEFERGWVEYRWRHSYSTVTATAVGIQRPAWDGQPLDGRSIVLLPEQGFGDTIHFARYAPLVVARGGHVILGCPLLLKRLLRSLGGVSQLASGDDPPVVADTWAPLLDLPAILGTRLDSVPAEVPYLHAEPALIDAFAARLASPLLRVGMVWAGSARHDNDLRRSAPLEQLAPLAAVPHVQYYSLQKDYAESVLSLAGWALDDLGPLLSDFADTAAILMHLDLVITVDTAVAHLAGALNRPVWLLLSRAHDWRWLDGWDHSPWYPSMRIFRQEVSGDWRALAERVAAEVSRLV
jgi:hypothetical protein